MLPRFFERGLAVQNARCVAKSSPAAADEVDEPPRFRGDALLVDRQRLRGIPAISRGVAGAVAGTDPYRALAAKETRSDREQGGA